MQDNFQASLASLLNLSLSERLQILEAVLVATSSTPIHTAKASVFEEDVFKMSPASEMI